MPLNDKLATVDALDAQVLEDLFALRYIAVRVPGFYDPTYAKSLAELLHQEIDDSASGGIYESNIDSYWNVMNDEERKERYLNVALPLQKRLRKLSAPYPSPVDLLRLAFDESWAGGATLMSMDGRKMPFGITRLWRTGSSALPHQDVFRRETSIDIAGLIRGQLGVNIYLDTADQGGELEVWDHQVTDEEYESLRDQYPGSYGYPRQMFPDETLVVSPEPGDLVMVNSACLHAVREITVGQRMTVSGFVGDLGRDQALRLWS